MEHDPQDLLHSQLAVHPIPDAESVCADTRKGEGMEIRRTLFGRKCGRCTADDAHIPKEVLLGLDGGLFPLDFCHYLC